MASWVSEEKPLVKPNWMGPSTMRAEEGGGVGLAQDGHGGGLEGRWTAAGSSKDAHTGSGGGTRFVVFLGTEMGEAEKSRRGESWR